jgi:hypothetical protein
VQALIQPYDENGDALEDLLVALPLAPGAYDVFTVHSFFGDRAVDIYSIEISTGASSNAVIGGFYLYGNMNRRNGTTSAEMLSGANM